MRSMERISGYQIKSSLYKGSKTQVYRCLRESDAQPVVLKTDIDDRPIIDSGTNYSHEFEVLQSFKSRNIITCHELLRDQNGYTLVFEDTEGLSLAHFLKENALDFDEKLSIAIQTVEGLNAIHQAGFIHKDINPNNLIYNPNTGQLKIIDFGICTFLPKEFAGIRLAYRIEGTLPYIAPEQTGRMNRSIDYRSDFYSLGATLYEVFTGTPPFEDSDSLRLIYHHLATIPPSPKNKNPKIPSPLSDLIMKLLSKEAENRYQGCWGIKQDLITLRDNRQDSNALESFQIGQQDIPFHIQIPEKLYGRTQNIEQVLNAFSFILEGKNKLLLIKGNAGIGKSSLIKEVYKPLTKEEGYFVCCKFDQYQRARPYSGILKVFNQIIQNIYGEKINKVLWESKISKIPGSRLALLTQTFPDLGNLIQTKEINNKSHHEEDHTLFSTALIDFLIAVCELNLPIVVFMDDIQWADSASLELISQALKKSTIRRLLILFAYRDNEVNLAHPLYSTLEALKETDTEIESLTIQPLTLENIQALLKDMLYSGYDNNIVLSQLLMEKTAGNPFFIGELIRAIDEEGFLSFDQARGQWDINLKQVKLMEVSANVASLITRRLYECNQNINHVLSAGSCVGQEFSFATLFHIIDLNPSITLKAIQQASKEGFIIPAEYSPALTTLNIEDISINTDQWENIAYRFSHDRIQQTVYENTSIEKRKKHHYAIAQYLKSKNNPDLIFEIVAHLNKSIDTLNNTERKELFESNCEAAQLAKSTASNQSYLDYLTSAEVLIHLFCWKKDFELLFDYYLAKLDALYLLGHHDSMPRIFDLLESKSRTPLQKIRTNKIRMFMLGAQNKKKEAIKVGLNLLALCKIHINETPTLTELKIAYAKTQFLIAFKSTHQICALPEMEDENKIEAQEIMCWLASHAHWTSRYLMPLIGFKSCILSLKNGHSRFSPLGYSILAMFSAGILKRFKAGFELADISDIISEKYCARETRSLTHLYNDFLIRIWKYPIQEQIPKIYTTYTDAIEHSIYEHAITNFAAYITCRYYANVNLKIVAEDCDLALTTTKQINQGAVSNFISGIRQTIYQFIVTTENPTQLEGQYFKESVQMQHSIKNGNLTDVISTYGNKVFLCCVFRDYSFAEQYLEEYSALSKGTTPTIRSIFYPFFSSIILLHLIFNGSEKKTSVLRKQLRSHKRLLTTYARLCPKDRLHKELFVLAEEYRYKRNFNKSLNLYSKALKLAEDALCIAEQAMIEERMGLLFFDKQEPGIAGCYLLRARFHFNQWGAKAKVAQLDTQYGDIFADFIKFGRATETMEINSSHCGSATYDQSLDRVDIAYAIKSAQVLSLEIKQEKIIEQLLTLLSENSAAHRVLLFLINGEEITLEASQEKASMTALPLPLNLSNYKQVSLSVLHHVIRTKTSLLIGDATLDDNHNHDHHIATRHIRSILCCPIQKSNQIRGVVYLERGDVTNVFTQDTQFICELLASQAAISIDNAQLYETLHQSEAQYRSIFDHAAEGVFRADCFGNINLANNSLVNMLCHPSIESLLEAKLSLVHLAKDTVDADFIRQLIENKQDTFDYELEVVTRDGSTFSGLISLRLVQKIKSGEDEYDCLLKNITHQKKSARLEIEKHRAEAAVEAKSVFLASVSHEIHNPLGGIIGITDILSETELNNAQANYVQLLKNSSELLLNLLNDIIDHSKIEANKMPLEEVLFDLADLISETLALYALQAADKGLFLFANIDPAVPSLVKGDPTRIKQILVNLLGNAFKFTEQGSITVDIAPNKKQPNQLYFAVQDTGIGISEENQGKLFELYTQEASHTTRKYGGTGLGLSICKSLSQMMGGQIGIYSTKGEGSTFWFTANLCTQDYDEHIAVSDKKRTYLKQRQCQIDFYSQDSALLNALTNGCKKDNIALTPYLLTADATDIANLAGELTANQQATLVIIHCNASDQQLLTLSQTITNQYLDFKEVYICLIEDPRHHYPQEVLDKITDWYFLRPFSTSQFYDLCYQRLNNPPHPPLT